MRFRSAFRLLFFFFASNRRALNSRFLDSIKHEQQRLNEGISLTNNEILLSKATIFLFVTKRNRDECCVHVDQNHIVSVEHSKFTNGKQCLEEK